MIDDPALGRVKPRHVAMWGAGRADLSVPDESVAVHQD